MILHKPGACTRKDKNDEMLIGKVELKAELFDRMEVFRMKRKVEEVKNESEMEKLCKMMGDNNKKLVESLTGVMMGEKKATVLTKPKNPPMWGDETFERYQEQVLHWDANSKDSDLNKYQDLLEVLKKKKGLKDYVMNTVLDRTQIEGRTVRKVLEVLREKYEKTYAEKTEVMIEKIMALMKVGENESGEQTWDKFYRLVSEFEKMNLNEHPRYMLGMIMIAGLEDSKKITDEEKRKFREVMENDGRKPKDEKVVIGELKKEYARLKIEGKRDEAKDEATSTFFARDSRMDKWKKGEDFKNFRRSVSKPGWYRTDSRKRWMRSGSRQGSRPRSSSEQRRSFSSSRRSDSKSNGRDFVSNKDIMEELKKLKMDVNELKNKAINVALVKDEEVKINDVFFAEDEEKKGMMILDLGAPCSLVGKEWMKEYAQENKVKVEDLEKRKCRKKFRFGPGEIYESEVAYKIPIVMKSEEEKEVFLEVEVYEVDAAVPMLCGKDAMENWKAVIDVDGKVLKVKTKMDMEGERVKLKMEETSGGHFGLKIGAHEEWKTEETVLFMEKEEDVKSYKKIKKVHETTNHKSEENMLYAYRNANRLDDEVRKKIKRVCEQCRVCKKFKKSLGRPKVSLPKVMDFNEIVSLDCKQFGSKNVLWMVDTFTRFIQGKVLKNKEALTVVDALNEAWNWRVGFPSRGFWADNGGEFQNGEMEEFASKAGFSIKFGPSYSPWSNGMNERNHYSADVVVKKIMEVDKKISLEQAVEMAAWTHNTNVNRLGFDPLSLVTGKAVVFPGVSAGDIATESLYDSEAVKRMIERHVMMTKRFREAEYENKLEKASVVQNRVFNNVRYKEGDSVYYQEENKKSWKGPVKVLAHKGRDVFILANGNLRKVADCKVQPYGKKEAEEGAEKEAEDATEESVDEVVMEDEKIEKRVTRSDAKLLREKETDSVGTYWMAVEKSECFDNEVAVLVVEIQKKDHGMPEVVEAKKKEIENLERYGTFEEVKDEGQERITSRWVITKKTKQDGQKEDYKGRLVARGFQENINPPQSDSPTALRESNKVFYAMAANEGFDLRSMDIKAAFLQANELDRDVYVEPPSDVKKEGVLWKLVKPLYGLKDASRKFWLRMKKIFEDGGLKTVKGDEAFYYKFDGEKLEGMVLTHVDDFSMAGTSGFLDELEEKIRKELNVSKVEKNKYRFTGIDIEKKKDGIVMSMEDYAESIEEIKEIRKEKKSEMLTKIENKLYRKYVGKISWLAENCRPDLAVTALKMARKSGKATVGDLMNVNSVVKRIKQKKNEVKFTKVGKKEDLVVTGVGDASYKVDEKAIGGNIVMLRDRKSERVVPLFWKSKSIQKVCHSSKEAETKNLVKLVDESMYQASIVEQVLFGGKKKVEVEIVTDSKPLLDSIASTKQVETKMMRPVITDMKEKLVDKSVKSFDWLETKKMVADVLTKENSSNKDLDGVMVENRFEGLFVCLKEGKNKVRYNGVEIKMDRHE